jgi:PIN domain nuclease of toxin-antitoxin system
MKLLLDTQILLWIALRPDFLPEKARFLITDEKNELYFSVVSLWEVAIKNSLNQSNFKVDPGALQKGLLDREYKEISITGVHAVAVGGLPMVHKDPFDRLLVAQAKTEGISLLTCDATIAEYPAPVILISKTAPAR